MGPMIRELAEEFQTRAVVAKMNVDDHQEIAARYGIQSIPTLIIFQNGEVVEQMVGTMPKTALAEKLESQLQPA
jgi:thioredoxin 1